MVWWGRNRPCFLGIPKFMGFDLWSFFELFNSRTSEVTQKVTRNRSPEQSYRRYEFFMGQLPPPNYKKKMFFWPFRGDNFSQGRDFWPLVEQNSELANTSEIVCPQHGLVGPKSSVLFGGSKIYGLRFLVIF